MLTSPATRPGSRLYRVILNAGVLISALVSAACDTTAGTDRASGPEIGQLINPAEPLRVALLVPGGNGSPDLEWLARILKNAARMAAADYQVVSFDLRIHDTAA